MEQPQIHNYDVNKYRPIKLKTVLISLFASVFIFFAAALQITFTLLGYEHIYKGVGIQSIDVGNLSKQEATGLLSDVFVKDIGGLAISLQTPVSKLDFTYEDIGVRYDIPDVVQKAYAIGHSGTTLQRLYQIAALQLGTCDIPVNYSYDKSELESKLKRFYNSIFIPVEDPVLNLGDGTASIHTGHHGREIDLDEVRTSIEQMIAGRRSGSLEIELITRQKAQIELDDALDRINCEVANAYYDVVSNQPVLVDHITGRHIEKTVLSGILKDSLNKDDIDVNLPLDVRVPEITSEIASGLLFRDNLATMSTSFPATAPSDKNRKTNIVLSSSEMNELVLKPGEVFSFNTVVGERTAEKGYKTARAYYLGKVIDGIGGGICQVSSTLYNAALYAGLEIVERRNHTFTVGYVPRGRDATVSYGDPDFKFRNSTNWPLKILTSVSKSNRLNITLIGTNEFPGRTIEIETKTIEEKDFKVVRINDPTLPEGETRIKQEGKKGYTVDTFKITRQDGKIVSRVKLHRSIYKPMEEQVLVGTKKPAPDA